MAREVVHDDHVSGAQLRHEHLGDIGFEPVAVGRPVQHHRRDHTSHPQARDQRGGLAMTVREAHPQPLAFRAAAITAGHVGGGPRFVYEHEPLGFEVELAVEPLPPLLQDVGPVLLDGMASFCGMARPLSPASDMMLVLEEERSGPMSIVILGVDLGVARQTG